MIMIGRLEPDGTWEGLKGGRGDDFFEAYLGIASEYAIVEHGKYVI